MKKLLCLLITFAMFFTLVSCKTARLEAWGISEISDYSNGSSLSKSDSANSATESIENSNAEESIDSANSTAENSIDVSKTVSNETSSSESSSTNSSDSTSELSPLLWKVTSNSSDGVIYLFGSIHVADESAYPLPEEVTDAYEACDALAVECDVTSTNINYMEMLSSFVYTDGSTIDQHISPETYKKAEKIIIDKYGKAYIEVFKKYKPVMWYILIDQTYTEQCALKAEFGIDMHFLNLAKEEKKEILEVESVQFQYKMLGNFSPELQELMLESTINQNIDDYMKNLNSLFEAWKAGDLAYLEQTVLAETIGDPAVDAEEKLLMDEYSKAMYTDRNIGMAETAKKYLANGKDVFFVVGAAHMVGDGGIVQLLTDAGYTVEQINTD